MYRKRFSSLGPIVGSMLKYKTQGLCSFLYGTLSAPVTAKEIKYMRSFLRETHRGRRIIAVDAAVGSEGDIGLIKVSDTPLFPGAGANKKLGSIGDISVMGIVAEKSVLNYGLLNTTRLNLVYSMAEIISDGLSSLLWEMNGRKRSKNRSLLSIAFNICNISRLVVLGNPFFERMQIPRFNFDISVLPAICHGSSVVLSVNRPHVKG